MIEPTHWIRESHRTIAITRAVSELAKGLKSASFYPPGHPALVQAIVEYFGVKP